MFEWSSNTAKQAAAMNCIGDCSCVGVDRFFLPDRIMVVIL